MLQQWTLLRQQVLCYLQTQSQPAPVLCCRGEVGGFCGDTEVGSGEEAHLFQQGVATEFAVWVQTVTEFEEGDGRHFH